MKPLKCASKLECENFSNLGECLFLCVFTNVIKMVHVDDIVRENNAIFFLAVIDKVHLALESKQVNQNSFKCFLPGQWR